MDDWDEFLFCGARLVELAVFSAVLGISIGFVVRIVSFDTGMVECLLILADSARTVQLTDGFRNYRFVSIRVAPQSVVAES